VTTAWAIAWLIGVILLLVFLGAVNAIVEYRRLKRTRAPRPLYILWQRTGAHVFPGRAAKGDLAGRLVWMAWDVRWTTFGESTARIVSSGARKDLRLRLDSPLVVRAAGSSPEVRLEDVTFAPLRQEVHYGQSAVSGRLEPAIMSELYATAVIVVYPATAASHANGARRRSGARESVSGSPRGDAPRMD
jgi:hypothetical protein